MVKIYINNKKINFLKKILKKLCVVFNQRVGCRMLMLSTNKIEAKRFFTKFQEIMDFQEKAIQMSSENRRLYLQNRFFSILKRYKE